MSSNEMLPVVTDGQAAGAAANGNNIEQPESPSEKSRKPAGSRPRSRSASRSGSARSGTAQGSSGRGKKAAAGRNVRAASADSSAQAPDNPELPDEKAAPENPPLQQAGESDPSTLPAPGFVGQEAALPASDADELSSAANPDGPEGAAAADSSEVLSDSLNLTPEEERPLFDLHRATEMWPEAWPDADMSGQEGTAGELLPVQVLPALESQVHAAPLSALQEGLPAPDSAAQEDRSEQFAHPGKKNERAGMTAAQESLQGADEAEQTPAYAAVGAGADTPAEQGKKTEAAEDAVPKRGRKAAADAESKPAARTRKRKMFISVLPGEQVEVTITKENQVEEYYVQMLHQLKTKGNIYKGVIHNVDANLQAAFIAYGAQKNGFLQIDEVHPDYYLAPHDPGKGKKYPLIQKVLKPGQEVLVQVVKEPTGGKGAFLSTYLSLPGRFLVLTPGRSQFGVSRKVEDEADRERLRSLLDSLPTQDGLGVIVRTASLSASKTSMLKDLQVLKRQWKEVRSRGTHEQAPCLIYEEPSLASRAVRDYLSDDIAEIWVDDAETAEEIRDTVSLIFPRRSGSNLIRLYDDSQRAMWEAFDLQRQIEQIYLREVNLPSGGRLVFDQTEALMAIDINSGKIAGRNNFESMALRTNIEAAQVIARQLRLRDIGGQIVIDFIEMRERNHWRELEKVMRNAMKNDRARYDVAKVSPFGLMEVVRQRLGSSSISVTMETCPCCNGTGLRRNMEWQALNALRALRHLAMHKADSEKRISYETDPEIALYLLNNKRSALTALEERYDVDVEIKYRQ